MKPNTIILGFADSEDLRKDDFEDPTSDFVSEKLDGIFPKLAGSGSDVVDDRKRNLKRIEFVRSISDVLKLRKNVCVCRNFQELDRSEIHFFHLIFFICPIWPPLPICHFQINLLTQNHSLYRDSNPHPLEVKAGAIPTDLSYVVSTLILLVDIS